MPVIVSSPENSCSTVNATKSSQGSPAATVRTAPEQEATSLSMPRVATLTTVPSKPASPTSTLEPPPRIRTGSPAASRSRTVCTSSASLAGVRMRRTGPPTRRVVCAASRPATPSANAATDLRSDTEIHLGPGRAEHLLALAEGLDAHRGDAALHRRHGRGEDDLGALGVVRDHHRPGE